MGDNGWGAKRGGIVQSHCLRIEAAGQSDCSSMDGPVSSSRGQRVKQVMLITQDIMRAT